MPELYHDLMFSAIFVIVMLAMIRFRKTVFGADHDAFRNIMIGLSLLMGFSLVQLGGHQSAFSGIPLLEDTAGRKMIEGLAIAAGLLFFLAGVGAWLPSLVKSHDDGKRLNKRYFCLKMISQSLDRNENLDDVYLRVMNCLAGYLGFQRCTAYKYASRQNHLRLSGAAGIGDEGRTQYKTLILDGTDLKTVLMSFRPTITVGMEPLFGAEVNPELIVPISFQGRLYGALFCWTGAVEVDDDLRDFMTVVGELLGRHTHGRVERKQKEFHQTQQSVYERLNDDCNRVSCVQELLPRLYHILKDLVGVEFLSIAGLDNSGENMTRHTIGASGRMLLEKGVSRRTHGTDVYTVYKERQPLIKGEVHENETSGEQDGLFLSCGMHSKLICPVKAAGRVVAALVLGHSRPGYFTRLHLRRVERLADIVAGVVQREQLSRNVEVREDLMLRLQMFQRHLLDDTPLPAVFGDACDVLTRRMKCTVARISLLDKDRTSLVSHACRSIRPTGRDLREIEALPLSLLPWHRMALDAGKAMLINQDDRESRMPPQESASALIPEIKSAILVPIFQDDTANGIISIGEARNWNRRSFGTTELIFAKDMAAKCSLALRIKKLQAEGENGRIRLVRPPETGDGVWQDMRSRLKSPLTSIIGSVELLKAKGRDDDELSAKYHDLILRSANRIKDLTEEEITAAVEAEERAPELVIG